MTYIFNEILNEQDDLSLRLENRLLMDADVISESVICAAEYVVSLLGYGLPKSVYQLTLFNLLSEQGFKLQTQNSASLGHEEGCEKEVIIVNKILVIECVMQKELISDSQRRLMFDHDNNSVTGIIVNFGDCSTKNSITRVYQNSVLH
ncbi:hypothetical protein MNBD_GAMMA05-660 [hydrothermal vent metagenome]|uniref:GxxExxY protein n=1 Tax=hydrothermal vent metagenome TaxID=652676 RepID=A0A3B0WSJ0_9ZZZZ